MIDLLSYVIGFIIGIIFVALIETARQQKLRE